MSEITEEAHPKWQPNEESEIASAQNTPKVTERVKITHPCGGEWGGGKKTPASDDEVQGWKNGEENHCIVSTYKHSREAHNIMLNHPCGGGVPPI